MMSSYGTKVFIVIAIIYSGIFFRIHTSKVKRSKNILTGQDRYQVISNKKIKYRGFAIATWKFENEFDDSFISIVKSRVRNFYKSNKKDSLFLKVNLLNGKYKYRELNSKEKLDNLIDKLVVNYEIEDWGKWDNDDIPLKFYIYKKFVYLLINHAYCDGYSAFKKYFNKFIICGSETKNIKLPKYSYIPLISEYTNINSLIQIASLKKRSLLRSEWNKRSYEEAAKRIRFKMDLLKIKEVKNRNKISFTSASLSFVLVKIFEITKKSSLNIGIISALNNKNGFNNLGFINFEVKRNLSVNKLATNIDNSLNKNKYQLTLTYLVTSLLDIDINQYDKVDVVYSSFPVSDGDIFANGNKIISGDILLPFSSAPIYIYSNSYSNKLHYMINANTKNFNDKEFYEKIKGECEEFEFNNDIIRM